MIEFKVKPHTIKPGTEMVEVVINGQVTASMYVKEWRDNVLTIHLISRHLVADPPEFIQNRYPEPSVVVMKLRRQD